MSIEATISVSEEQVEFFRREGYLAIGRITTSATTPRFTVWK